MKLTVLLVWAALIGMAAPLTSHQEPHGHIIGAEVNRNKLTQHRHTVANNVGCDDAMCQRAEARSEYWFISGHLIKITDFWLAIFTALLFFAGVIQSFFLYRSIKETTKQHVISNRAFAYLKNLSVVALLDQNGTATAWRISAMWNNSGNTPTKNGLVSVGWEKRKGDIPYDFGYPYGDAAHIVFIGPNAEVGSGIVEIPNSTLNYAAQFRERIYIWGVIQYRDVFKNTRAHECRFCTYLDVTDSGGQRLIGFVQHGPYNGSDDDDRKVKWPKDPLTSVIASVSDIHRK